MSGNPVPQHNPTDGIGVAAKVIVTSDGQGGSALVTKVAASEYSFTLSKSAASGWNSAVRLTAIAQDVLGGLYNPQGNYFVVNRTNVFTAVASGTNNNTVLVSAVAVGFGSLNVCFPTFDNVEAGTTPEKVYCKIDITVIP